MKSFRILSLVAIVATLMTSCNKFGGNAKLKNESDSISYYIGLSVGTSIKENDISDFNAEVFSMAVQEAFNQKEPKKSAKEINGYITNYFKKIRIQQSKKYLTEGQEFLAKNRTRSGIITTASGLQYEVLKEGTGPRPKETDIVTVNYKGTLLDGFVFESTYDNGQPATFPLNRVIRGWTEALQLMKVGSRYKIYLSSDLAYGTNPSPGGKIKPNMALIFEIELLSIQPPQPQQQKGLPGKKIK